MRYKKPRKLREGDTVAIVSPSWGGPNTFPNVYENGLLILKEWGLRIKEYPTARADAEFLRNNPQVRAKDINDAFADDEVRAIFVSIGGDDSVRILPFINADIVRENQKIVMGYSDTTTLHVFCSHLGLVTFYGPSIMAGFSQMKALPNFFQSHVHDMLFDAKQKHEYEPYNVYCDGYPDWSGSDNLGKVNSLKKNDGWHWLQGHTRATGELFGGCLEVLEMMKATPFWPRHDFWNDKIFFLETSEEKPTIHHIDHELRNYGAQGVFDRISGLIVARPRDYSDEEKRLLEERIVRIVAEEFGRKELPIVANFDIGHTDPQLVLPMGVTAEMDCTAQRVSLIDSWLSE